MVDTFRLEPDEVTIINKEAMAYIQRISRWRDYMPVETIPLARVAEWRKIEPFVGPAFDLDGTATQLAAAAFTPETVQVGHFGYHFEWKEIDVASSRRSGTPLQETDIAESLSKMTKAIERFVLQGTMAWEAPDINGLLSNATDVGPTVALDAVYWNSVGGPAEHARAAYQVLNDNGFDPPYTWVLSANLRPGMSNFNSDYNDRIASEVVKEMGFEKTVFVPAKATAATRYDTTIYPMKTPVADDGAWAAMKVDKNNFSVLEVSPPVLALNPVMDMKSRSFYGRLDYWATTRITHPSAVVTEFEVDLAA